MINVKGTKTASEPEDGANVYRRKEDDKPSKTPFLLGGFLAGVILFIKSLFGDAEAAPANPGPATSGGADHAAPVEEEIVQAAPEPVAQDADISTLPPPEEKAASPARISDQVVVSLFKSPAVAKDEPARAAVLPGSEDPYDSWLSNNPELAPSQHGGNNQAGTKTSAAASAPGASPLAARERKTNGDAPNINEAPVRSRPVILRDISASVIVFIALDELLAHTTDPDGDVLRVENLTASSGTLVVADAGYHYTPDPAVPGPVQLRYEITDGTHSVNQTAHFVTLPEEVAGTLADDILIATDHAEFIDAQAGNDTIEAMGGADIIHGGDGDDHINGGSGDDIIFGGAGNDVIDGGAGDDAISGGDGDDEVHGGDGDDVIDGDDGNDLLDGGAGRDIIAGGTGDDIIISARDGADDVMDGGAGTDTIDFGLTTGGVTVDLRAGTAVGDEIGKDEIKDIEIIVGGSGDDMFLVGKSSVTLVGGQGRDTYRFDFDDDDDFDDFDDDDGPDHHRHAATITDFDVGDVIMAASRQIYRHCGDDHDDDDHEALDSLLEGGTPDAVLSSIDYIHQMFEDGEYTVLRISQDDLGDIAEVYLKGLMELDYDAHC